MDVWFEAGNGSGTVPWAAAVPLMFIIVKAMPAVAMVRPSQREASVIVSPLGLEVVLERELDIARRNGSTDNLPPRCSVDRRGRCGACDARARSAKAGGV